MDQLAIGIPKTSYDKLISAGFTSSKEILLLNDVELQEKASLSKEDANNILNKIAEILFQDKIQIASNIPAWFRLTSGCENINAITKGGFPVHGITELYGAAGVGKTQLCIQATLNVQLPTNKGGLSRGAVYICTEDAFPTKRLELLCKHFYKKYNLPQSSNFTDQIFIDHTADLEQLRKCISSKLLPVLTSVPIGLIVIDSIAGAVRSENKDCDYSKRSKDLYSLAMHLQELAKTYNLAVICTNQVTDNVITGGTQGALGYAWKNLITCRFKISRISMESTERVFEVINAPDLPPKECNFIIEEDGVNNF